MRVVHLSAILRFCLLMYRSSMFVSDASSSRLFGLSLGAICLGMLILNAIFR